MKTHVRKWGNSDAIRIPKGLADQIGISQDSLVTLSVKDQQIVVAAQSYNLADLVSQIDETNIHSETDTGSIIGKEIW
ncbi:AbrB/MazE/SpoVT family DNA-binding domain-containing protein [Candidatus Peregrinibacteria bacterium CG11_big_fil_rev_8_21_14_0_20_41_10]|nr:MAG: AbrB/MazE/SpoVT family DNA-binding domain-containing protein [Candidatus Peregrinibacteria bacterium CG11_big_fil_rev_8_21_14_0_20_41_10]PIZ73638.1 MAG: AbrB/MazE/SpoVT family DNA-binding domain-containing protein [Candidatus Peregrinibacteria bacterium CG_4_10_14_0_2_um_filter_41_8]PJC38003.1 MAG: AbrB/MazE/SpoVT family DNA-binding domain-containing protein [Candidatus Peregrinibacteria bacterium CG_4_9_14_0_2_um_filter_41_14]